MTQSIRRRLVAILCVVVLTGTANGQESEPFRTRNLSPLVAIFGIPAWYVPNDSFEIGVSSELANHYRLSARGTEQLILDGETWRNSLFLSKSLGTDWTIAFELPYYRVDGGNLDDIIDGWHSIFSLPDGGRNSRPEGVVEFQLSSDGSPFYQLSRAASGVGDAQIGLTYRLGRTNPAYVSAWVKLPTGKESMLAGSGASDSAITILRPRSVQLSKRTAGYYWGFGLLRLGNADLINYKQDSSGFFAVIGGSLSLTESLGIKIQIDMHSAFYRSPLEEIGEDSYQATLGGWWQFAERGVLDFGVNEDLQVSTSPDVVLHVNARWSW